MGSLLSDFSDSFDRLAATSGSGQEADEMGQRLIAAAKNARVIARREADPKTYRIHVPADVDAVIRKKPKLMQAECASHFGIAPGTLKD